MVFLFLFDYIFFIVKEYNTTKKPPGAKCHVGRFPDELAGQTTLVIVIRLVSWPFSAMINTKNWPVRGFEAVFEH